MENIEFEKIFSIKPMGICARLFPHLLFEGLEKKKNIRNARASQRTELLNQ